MLTDGELLRRYAEEGSQAAFTELVQRHLGVVYLAALRRVGGNAHSADDVTQRIFTDLARKAKALQGRPSLAGWLHTGTRFAAAEVVRAERRRRTREQEAHAMREFEPDPPISGEYLDPFLDEVLDRLEERDREAVLLHFFEGRTFAEVGSVLSLSADAVRMRVNRALDRLRGDLARRGIKSSEEALASSLAAQATLAIATPTALEVASRALKGIPSPGGAASTAARLFQAIKSSAVVPWAGLGAMMAVFGIAWVEISRTEHASPKNAATTALTAEDATIPNQASQPTGQPASPDPAPPTRSEPPPASAGVAPVSRFVDLSEPEKRILKALWELNGGLAAAPGRRFGVSFPPGAANAAELAAGQGLLLARGWVQYGRNERAVRFTPEGFEFCRVHQDEIAAYPAVPLRK